MYLSSYYSWEGEIIAAPFAFPVLSQIFISYGMGAGDLNLVVGLRPVHGPCRKRVLCQKAGFDTSHRSDPRSAGSHLAQLTVIIAAGVLEDVLGLLSPFIPLGHCIQLQRDCCTYFPYHHPHCCINMHF